MLSSKPANTAPLQEWANFLTVLNKNSEKPFLKKGKSPVRMIDHLEKALPTMQN
jgi:hypothetical protein